MLSQILIMAESGTVFLYAFKISWKNGLTDENPSGFNDNENIEFRIGLRIICKQKKHQDILPAKSHTLYCLRIMNNVMHFLMTFYSASQFLYSDSCVPVSKECIVKNRDLKRILTTLPILTYVINSASYT
jgi:hypothetical protein